MIYFKSRDNKVCNAFFSKRLKTVKKIDSGREGP